MRFLNMMGSRQKKTPLTNQGRSCFGGDGGIRTLDTLLAYAPLAGEYLRPLGHVSSNSRHSSPVLLAIRLLRSKQRPALSKARKPHQALASSRPKALCSARTASSMYFSSMTTEVLISEVVIIWMLMPSSDRVLNMVEAMPTWLRMPMPTMETLQILGSPTISRAPSLGCTSFCSSSSVLA